MGTCIPPFPARRVVALAISVMVSLAPALSAQQPQLPGAVFRASRDLVSIDVVVRDRSGAIVRGLSARDFEIREDGRPQEIVASSFQEVDGAVAPGAESTMLQRLGLPPVSNAAAVTTPPDLSGRRLMLLLFDLSAMEPEEVERGVQAALKYVDTQMSNADLVAVASLTWQLTILTDFTGDRAALREVLERLVAVDVSTGDAAGADPASESAADAGGTISTVAATDARLRALRIIADALAPIPQKKALLYFTAGLGNSAQDTPAELRAATSAATKANLTVYPVDTRGLQTIIPSGPARVASRRGEGLFSGRDVNDQFSDLTASQDTMVSMASATGGRMFSGANDVTAVFTRVQRDTAAYYLLGYSSSNTTRDGRFRRVQVRVTREGLRVEARAGYYGDRDFAHMSRADREGQLEEYLAMPAVPSALSVHALPAAPRLESDPLRMLITITGPAALVSTPGHKAELDVLAKVEDEQGRTVARLRDTVEIPRSDTGVPSAFAYTGSVVLPPGRFILSAVVRENVDGVISGAQTTVAVPDPANEVLDISSNLLFAATLDNTSGTRLTSLTADVWDGIAGADPERLLIVGAMFFRDSVRVMDVELPETSRTQNALGIFRAYSLPVAPGTIGPGRYMYQVTVLDPASGRFAVTRTAVDIP